MAMTVVEGVFLATGWAKKIAGHTAVYNGHMTLALTSMTFAVMHALSYLLQTLAHLSVVQTFVPFARGEGIEVALGVVGLELMIGAASRGRLDPQAELSAVPQGPHRRDQRRCGAVVGIRPGDVERSQASRIVRADPRRDRPGADRPGAAAAAAARADRARLVLQPVTG